MAATTTDPLVYYALPGLMTDPGDHAVMLNDLPSGIPALVQVVQNNLIHIWWTERYGLQLPEERKREAQIRRFSTMLAYIKTVDDRPLTIARPMEQRLVHNCRHFSVFLCALLRHQGIPARPRCGFATYFAPNHHEDHWVCEYWDAGQGRWVLVDAQLDAFQQNALSVSFDPLDVPRDQFLTGGVAWQICRRDEADPNTFGIFHLKGMWFVQGNLVRDLAALNRMELLPWDNWGVMDGPDADTEETLALMDQTAVITLADNGSFAEMRAFYEGDERLRVPDVIRSYVDGATPHNVDITAREIPPIPAS
ncbi:MAG: transglutaminase domain-containing protein [Chloroflexi bacterium]|nr:transglutaminase domain-containing protein [Chloroflexota bacterium]